MAMPAPVLRSAGPPPVPHLRVVRATVQAQAATSSVPRKLLLWLAVGALSIGLALLIRAQSQHPDDHDPDQAWFWTPEWQAGEAEADADIAAGRTTYHDSDEAFEQALLARMKPE